MNIRPILKFRFFKNIKITAIFFAVFFAIILLSSIIPGNRINITGIDFLVSIFIFILALNGINDENKMCLQNGVSRRTSFVSTIINAGIFSAILSLSVTFVMIFLNSVQNGACSSIFTMLYNSNSVSESFLFFFVMYMGVYGVATFLGTIVARVPTWTKLVIYIGTPFVIPFTLSNLPVQILQNIKKFFDTILGVETLNPFIGIITIFIISIIFYLFTYLINKRITYK